MQVNIGQLKKWIAALDSGEYKQGKGHLQSGDSYCCLAVGCLIIMPSSDLRMKFGKLYGDTPIDQRKAPEWLRKINMDFKKRTDISLVSINDYHKFTFPEIATLLELVYIHKMLD